MIPKIKITGHNTAFDLVVIADRIDGTVKSTIREIGSEARVYVKGSITSPAKSGRDYGRLSGRRALRRLGGRNGVIQRRLVKVKAYTASAPGEAPASFTGALARSIGVVVKDKGYRLHVFAAAKLAPHRHLLELGTDERVQKSTGRRVGRVQPRPFIAPAQDLFGEILAQRLELRTARDVEAFNNETRR
jgi:hypothetical protein